MSFKTTTSLLILLTFFLTANSQIIGGDIADDNKIRHLVYIKVTLNTNQKNIQEPYKFSLSGGSILNDRWILTCAHSFNNKNIDGVMYRPYGMTIKAGTKDLRDQRAQIRRVKIHFNRSVFKHREVDAALIFLGEYKLDMTNPKVQSADLLHSGQELPAGTLCMISGWGDFHRKEDGKWTTPRYAFQGQIEVKEHRSCQRIESFDREKHLCIGMHKQLVMAARGDSGTPVSCRIGEKEEVVAGYLVRMPIEIGRNFRNEGLGVAMDVRKINEWIRMTMQIRRPQRNFTGEMLCAFLAAAIGAAAFLKLRT